MSEYDNGFAKAQRAYDNMQPPEAIEISCPDCHGTGTLHNDDTTEPAVVCKRCDGCGEIAVSQEEYRRLVKDKNDE